MEKLKKIFNDFTGSILKTALRFPLASLMTASVAVCFSYMIIEDNMFNDEPVTFLTLALFAGALAGCLLTLISEYQWKNRVVEYGLPVVLTGVVYYIIYNHHETSYTALWYFGLVTFLTAMIFWILYRHNDSQQLAGYLLGKAVYAMAVCMVGYCGLMVSILAFHYLIHDFDELYKIALTLYVWINGFLAVMTFLSRIPEKDQQITVSETVNSIVGKVAFFVYLILIVILYLYILKIIISWQLPVGRLNWFGSFALLFYVFFLLTVQKQSGPLQNLFCKYGAILLVPVLAVQLFAIYIRISAYGFTMLRYLSLAMIIAAVSFMVIQMSPLKLEHGFLVIAVLSVLVTVGPLNAIDVPIRDQQSRLRTTLEKYGGYVEGKIKMIDPDDSDREIIAGAYDYLKYSDGNLSEFGKAVTKLSLNEIIKKKGEEWDDHDYSGYNYYISNNVIDIAGYSKMTLVDGHEANDVCGKDLTELCLQLLQETRQGSEMRPLITVEVSENQKLVLTELSVSFRDDEITYVYWQGYLLEK